MQASRECSMARRSEPRPAARKASESRRRRQARCRDAGSAGGAASARSLRTGRARPRHRRPHGACRRAPLARYRDPRHRRAAGVTWRNSAICSHPRERSWRGFSKRIDKIVLEGTTDDLPGETVRSGCSTCSCAGSMRSRPTSRRCGGSCARVRRATRCRWPPSTSWRVNSQRFMLAAAGIDTEGPARHGQAAGRGARLWRRTLDTWFEDDDPGLARTMAALDRELRRGRAVHHRAE